MKHHDSTRIPPQMVMHTCGHYGRYHLYGLLGERLEKIAKLEAMLCRKCSGRSA